jgi:signal transduction histidine kinase/ligand-binding sensor domain-containing protein
MRRPCRGWGGVRWVVAALMLLGAIEGRAPAHVSAQAQLSRRGPSPSSTRPDYPVEDRIKYQTFGLTEGLPQSSPNAFAIDLDGFIWGSTFGGIFRFDGRDIAAYSPAQVPYLLAGASSAITSSRDGSLWVGRTRGGIGRFRGAELLDTLPSHPLPDAAVTSLFEADDGALWGVANFSPVVFDEGIWWSADTTVSVRRRTKVIPDSAGAVLMASDGGVWRLKINTAAGQIDAERVTHSQTSDVIRDRQGRLWVGGDRGLRVVRTPGDAEEIVVPDVDFRTVIEDQRGNIWAFGEIGVIVSETDNGWQVRRLPEDQPDQYLGATSTFLTPDGLVLVGILSGGLRAFELTPVEVWRRSSSRPFREASSMVPDRRGGLWVGAQCDGVYRLDGQGHLVDHILPWAACAFSLALDARDRLWIGDSDRVRRYSPDGSVKEWRTEVPGRRTPVDARPLVDLGGDSVLVGLSDGRIAIIDADDRMRFPADWQLGRGGSAFTIERGQADDFWLGLDGVVAHRRSDKSFAFFDSLDGVPSGQLRVVQPRPDGSVWLGSYGGGLVLLRADDSIVRVPLADPTVVALLEEHGKGVWLQQNSGLTWLAQQDISAIEQGDVGSLRPQNFGLELGIPEGNSGRPPLAQINPSRVAFGSVDGIVIVDRLLVPEPPLSAVPKIDRMVGMVDDLPVSNTVRLGPRERYLRVHVTIPDFRTTGVIPFRYRLEGRDPDWITVGSDRWVELAGLMPGTYRLLVEAGVRTGEWEPAEPVAIRVVPVWSEMIWLRITILGLLATAVLNWIRLRFRVAQQREASARAEAQLLQQVADQREQHQRDLARVGQLAVAGEMSAAMVHQLGQPLGSMVNDAAAARIALHHSAPDELANRLTPILDDLVAGGRRVGSILNGLRGFFSEGLKNTEQVDMVDLAREAINLLMGVAQQARVSVDLDADRDLPKVSGDRGLLLQALVVVLTNAIEAAQQNDDPWVHLRLRRRGQTVSVTIVDGGPGIPQTVYNRLYDAFVTDKPKGMGMGLPVAHRIVQAHGGWIRARNTGKAGAAFRVTLPLGTMLDSDNPDAPGSGETQ